MFILVSTLASNPPNLLLQNLQLYIVPYSSLQERCQPYRQRYMACLCVQHCAQRRDA